MARVGKEKRLRRRARLERNRLSLAEYADMAERFRAFMAERGIQGRVVHDRTGVTVIGGAAMGDLIGQTCAVVAGMRPDTHGLLGKPQC